MYNKKGEVLRIILHCNEGIQAAGILTSACIMALLWSMMALIDIVATSVT